MVGAFRSAEVGKKNLRHAGAFYLCDVEHTNSYSTLYDIMGI